MTEVRISIGTILRGRDGEAVVESIHRNARGEYVFHVRHKTLGRRHWSREDFAVVEPFAQPKQFVHAAS